MTVGTEEPRLERRNFTSAGERAVESAWVVAASVEHLAVGVRKTRA